MDAPLTPDIIRFTPARTFDSVVTSLLVLGSILLVAALRYVGTTKPTSPPPPSLASINPNTAPWWELMVLPDIGETTARKIVEYRGADARRKPIFHKPADLEPVPGIGPKTIQRISPYLWFGD